MQRCAFQWLFRRSDRVLLYINLYGDASCFHRGQHPYRPIADTEIIETSRRYSSGRLARRPIGKSIRTRSSCQLLWCVHEYDIDNRFRAAFRSCRGRRFRNGKSRPMLPESNVHAGAETSTETRPNLNVQNANLLYVHSETHIAAGKFLCVRFL